MNILILVFVVLWVTYTLLTGDYGVKWQYIGIFYECCAWFVLWVASGNAEEDALYGGDDE
jgi:hypothetical protein